MVARESAFRGCLLGLAVGDAMGCTVDARNLEEIRRDYGPNGLMGYDLVNGYADITSYTQLAAYTANGLLIGLSRGQLRGIMAPYIQYIAMAGREWAQTQQYRRTPDTTRCWISRIPELRRRMCMDIRMLDTLTRGTPGTPAEPGNQFTAPGSLTCAIPAGLFFTPERMSVGEIGQLGAETVALTHGDAATFLSGAVLAYCVAGIVQDPDTPLQEQMLQASQAVSAQFGKKYPQAAELHILLRRAIAMTRERHTDHAIIMERIGCSTASQVLAGAFYAVLTAGEDFDSAMITAVNHSGRSAAVGAVTGALLGAKLGEEALPEFYLECLEPTDALRTLADDLAQGCPMERQSRLFDDDWDRKYIQGYPVEKGGWCEE